MELALYDPAAGYYARGPWQVGRAGDFFTSVSVGPLFGQLLARRCLRWRRDAGIAGRWRILELGAHDGTLARDILTAMATLDPAAHAALEYAVAEPLDAMRQCQWRTLAAHRAAVRWVGTPHELAADPLPGIAIGNELLDALPCHLITRHHRRWHHTGVAADAENPGTLTWCDLGPATGALAEAAARIDASHLADGYRTEVRTNYAAIHAALATALDPGHVIWIDYGFARPEYYDPARTEGTLRTFSRHRAGDDPLAAPGEADITAHVDFTAVAEAAATAGFSLAAFQSQGAWLTREARDWLTSQETNPAAATIRQFQTLTHPGHLGARFHVIELTTAGPAATAAEAHRCGLQ